MRLSLWASCQDTSSIGRQPDALHFTLALRETMNRQLSSLRHCGPLLFYYVWISIKNGAQRQPDGCPRTTRVRGGAPVSLSVNATENPEKSPYSRLEDLRCAGKCCVGTQATRIAIRAAQYLHCTRTVSRNPAMPARNVRSHLGSRIVA